MSGLLYPAYQKFYSAISCLNRFCKEQDFFQNIASLDTFFSEYRSITLVMQKSFDLLSESFTVENDVPLSALIGSI